MSSITRAMSEQEWDAVMATDKKENDKGASVQDGFEYEYMKQATESANKGGTTDYYDIPKGAVTLNDLIDHKEMSWNVANIFKACYRLDEKPGVDKEYDLNKIVYYANRELAKLRSKSK